MIHKHFIVAVTALAIGVTGLSTIPARADNDTAKIIAGVAALAIIGTAISRSSRNDSYGVSRQHSYGYQPRYGHRRHRGHQQRHRAHRKHNYGYYDGYGQYHRYDYGYGKQRR